MSNPDFPSLGTLAEGPDSNARIVSAYRNLTPETLNLERELLEQYNIAKKLIYDAEYDESIPLNQKAQAVNSAASVLGSLIKNQAELYNLERIKKIEAVLIRTLQEFPDLQKPFMAAYSEALQ